MPEITQKKAAEFARRWRALAQTKSQLDFDMAALARQIRDHFPSGSSGDFQFRSWAISTLSISVSTAGKLLRASVAIKKVPKKADWINLGGWMSITLVSSLTGVERTKLLRECSKKVEKQRRPISYSTVRNLAFGLGVRSRNNGRRNVWESEEHLGHLRAWLTTLYDQYELPPVPKGVSEALGGTKLGRLTNAVKSA